MVLVITARDRFKHEWWFGFGYTSFVERFEYDEDCVQTNSTLEYSLPI